MKLELNGVSVEFLILLVAAVVLTGLVVLGVVLEAVRRDLGSCREDLNSLVDLLSEEEDGE